MEFQAVSGPKFTGFFSSNAGGIAIVSSYAYDLDLSKLTAS